MKTIVSWIIIVVVIIGGVFFLTRDGSDIETSGQQEVVLNEQNDSKVSGSATLEEVEGGVKVLINLGDDTGVRVSHIHNGTCENLGAIVFPLTNTENGQSETLVAETLENISSGTRAINVHESAENLGSYIACGDIVVEESNDATENEEVVTEEDEGGVIEEGEENAVIEEGEEGTTMAVPAPGNEDVEEMIVNDGGNIVTYTKNGFSPKEITIKQGETVTFINESGGGMWVASAIHPTHRLYPIKSDDDCSGSSFDQCQNSSSGISWDFTFDIEGEYGYHNHVRANHWGKVIVE